MKINSIQSSNKPAFNGFRATPTGLVKLAEDFVQNPKLEQRFIKTIVNPLKNTNTDVVFDGYSTNYKNLEGSYSTIIQAYKDSNEIIVRPISGANKWCRNIFRPQNNTELEPVKEFAEYPYKEFEAAKNIAQNIAIDAGDAVCLSEKIKKFIFPPEHTLAKKVQEIMDYLA